MPKKAQEKIASLILLLLFIVSCAPKLPMAVGDIPASVFQNDSDLSPLIKEIGKARIVLIGDASHGSSEFYSWRMAISKRLISEKGFNIIAVEGDWKDCYGLNSFIKDQAADSNKLYQLLDSFNRFPGWLWKNQETSSFLQWLHLHAPSTSFYGLDIFSISETLAELTKNNNSEIRKASIEAITCFKNFMKDEPSYSLQLTNVNCSGTFNRLDQLFKTTGKNKEPDFVTTQMIRAAVDGEKYYRIARTDRAASWNIRDRHMLLTIKNILATHARNAKVIVWVHNTHTGDAHYSEMLSTGQTTLGELLRQEYRKSVYLVGTATYAGTVIAAKKWGGKTEIMKVPPAKPGSLEALLHDKFASNCIIFSKNIINHPVLKTWINQRAIGAVYKNEREIFVPSVIPRRYDALLFIDSTHALHPL
jgi:erythromycin esterase